MKSPQSDCPASLVQDLVLRNFFQPPLMFLRVDSLDFSSSFNFSLRVDLAASSVQAVVFSDSASDLALDLASYSCSGCSAASRMFSPLLAYPSTWTSHTRPLTGWTWCW